MAGDRPHAFAVTYDEQKRTIERQIEQEQFSSEFETEENRRRNYLTLWWFLNG